jgi:hypothetical protein
MRILRTRQPLEIWTLVALLVLEVLEEAEVLEVLQTPETLVTTEGSLLLPIVLLHSQQQLRVPHTLIYRLRPNDKIHVGDYL